MPNWCSNGVTISHEDPAKIKALAEAMKDGKFCNFVIPVPQELTETIAGSYGDDEKQRALEEQTARNVEKYGVGNWYDFCVSRWGTKWDVGGDGYEAQDIPGGLMLTFDSAWSPPIDAFATLVDKCGFSIRAMYYEPGMAFAGIWEDGDDDFYEYGGMNSEQIADTLPEELDEAFGISESVAEWEAENEEENE